MFQFTHPGRGATSQSPTIGMLRLGVSIHAPREGCDIGHSLTILREQRFNSRTPGGVRQVVGRTTLLRLSFNSRTPGGVRPRTDIPYIGRRNVSIHAPREGCDSMVQSCLLWGG